MASFGLNDSRRDEVLILFMRGVLTRQRVEISALQEMNELPTSEMPTEVGNRGVVTVSHCDVCRRVAFGASSLSQPWQPKMGKQRVIQTVRTNSF